MTRLHSVAEAAAPAGRITRFAAGRTARRRNFCGIFLRIIEGFGTNKERRALLADARVTGFQPRERIYNVNTMSILELALWANGVDFSPCGDQVLEKAQNGNGRLL